jgi:hypothetical protein
MILLMVPGLLMVAGFLLAGAVTHFQKPRNR